MKIEIRKISELKPAAYNPRKLSPKAYEQLKKSLEKEGIVLPILVNSNPRRKDVIIGGHQRVKVWYDMGNKTVPTVSINLSKKREQELNIRLNKTGGEWDFDLLFEYNTKEQLVEYGFDRYEVDFDTSYGDSKDKKTGKISKRKSIKVEFKAEDYDLAYSLVKNHKEKGTYIGGELIKTLQSNI